MATPQSEIEFAPPGPGTWEMDAAHFHRPVFGTLQKVFPAALAEGMRDCCARYGLLLETLAVEFVHGFPYTRARIVGVPVGGKPPPRFVMRIAFALMTIFHPEVRRRMAIAKTLFEEKPWRAEIAGWDASVRSATIDAHMAIAAIDPGPLSDAELAQHLSAVEAHATRMLRQDHSYNATIMVALGDYLAHASDWTGLTHSELTAPLGGFSPISAGQAAERVRLVAALRADARARELIDGPAPAREVWARLREWPGEVGEAARAFQLIFGNGLTHGIDLTLPTVNEQPGPVLAALRVSVARGAQDDALARAAEAARIAVRDKVPAAHQAKFDELLEDARLTYRLRDERHLYGVMPVFGIARRALLEAGRRLHARRALPDAELAVLCTADELGAALRGEGGPPVDEVLERRRLHQTLEGGAVPERLGPEAAPPPPLAWLPNEGARRVMRALDLFLAEMRRTSDVKEAPPESTTLRGMAASVGTHEGIVRVCATVQDLDRVQPGDVLVAALTTPAINVVLPLLGAIVTDKGGALSHAAIVSREYGIPCVVGTRHATTMMREGQRVRVDGAQGVVTVLG